MRGRDSQGVWDGHGHAAVFNVENQQGPRTAQRTLFNVTWHPGWEGRLDPCTHMAESLCFPLKTITTLLIGYTPRSNKKFNKVNVKNHK